MRARSALPPALQASPAAAAGSASTQRRVPQLFRARTASPGALADATRSLAVMLSARVHLLPALTTTTGEVSDAVLRAAFERVKIDLETGRAFSEALGRQNHVFAPLYVQLVAVGEETGTLADVLLRLARYLEASGALRRKLRGALVYPSLVLTVAALATAFMLTVVVPTFGELFRDVGGTLPAPTRFLLALSHFLTSHALLMLVLLGLTIWAVRALVRAESLRARREALLLRLPLFGTLYRESLVARVCRTLGTLLSSGVRLDVALDVLLRGERSVALREVLGRLRRGVVRGRSLAELLVPRKDDPLQLPALVASMLAAGEAAAEVDQMLLYVAEHYESELDSQLTVLTTLIEPLLILVIGLVVGTLLVALYLPMFDLIGTIR